MLSHQAEPVLALIRAEIKRYGQSIVGCDQLLLFALRSAPIHSQFEHIFAMAATEGWSLEFQPDGMVRFADLRPRMMKIPEWAGNADAAHARETALG